MDVLGNSGIQDPPQFLKKLRPMFRHVMEKVHNDQGQVNKAGDDDFFFQIGIAFHEKIDLFFCYCCCCPRHIARKTTWPQNQLIAAWASVLRFVLKQLTTLGKKEREILRKFGMPSFSFLTKLTITMAWSSEYGSGRKYFPPKMDQPGYTTSAFRIPVLGGAF